jgi:cardiolipin synthase
MNILKFRKEWIPNYISVFRGLLVPLYAFVFFYEPWFGEHRILAAGVIFLVAGGSDLLDGYLARRNGWITDFGKILDPLADKMMELAVAACFAVELGQGFIVLASILLLKELAMMIGSFVIMRRTKLYLPSTWYGKLATFLWYVLIFTVTFIAPSRGVPVLYNSLCGALIGVMLVALALYCRYYKDEIRAAFLGKKTPKETKPDKDETK